MPEGDSVARVAARLARDLVGHRIVSSDVRVPRFATADLAGQVVTASLSRGKHLLLRTDAGVTLHTHLRMQGSWTVLGPGRRLPSRVVDRARVLLHLDDGRTAVALDMPVVELLTTSREADVVGHLGPDLLAQDFDAALAAARLAREPDRPIVAAVLDQRNVAGAGNLWTVEALFLRGLFPWTPVQRVASTRSSTSCSDCWSPACAPARWSRPVTRDPGAPTGSTAAPDARAAAVGHRSPSGPPAAERVPTGPPGCSPPRRRPGTGRRGGARRASRWVRRGPSDPLPARSQHLFPSVGGVLTYPAPPAAADVPDPVVPDPVAPDPAVARVVESPAVLTDPAALSDRELAATIERACRDHAEVLRVHDGFSMSEQRRSDARAAIARSTARLEATAGEWLLRAATRAVDRPVTRVELSWDGRSDPPAVLGSLTVAGAALDPPVPLGDELAAALGRYAAGWRGARPTRRSHTRETGTQAVTAPC